MKWKSFILEEKKMNKYKQIIYSNCAKILSKILFTKEGLIRQGKMVNTWCDYYVYGIPASDIH